MAEGGQRAGALYRWTRRFIVQMASLTLLSWIITTTGLYFWFNIGSEDRFRFEYGRIVWRHVDGGTASRSAGVDGGGGKVLWSFEQSERGSHRVTRIPLWMPFLLFAGTATSMTVARRRRTCESASPPSG